MNKTKRRNDILLVAALIIIAVAAFFAFMLFGKEGDSVVVIQNGKEISRYSLNDNIRVDIVSSDGKLNTLVIENGEAYISYADCPDKICVAHRRISKVGEVIACTPNKLAISVESPDR